MKPTKEALSPQIRAEWSCDHCNASGTVLHYANESCDDIAVRAEEAHATASEECHAEHGRGGVRYTQP